MSARDRIPVLSYNNFALDMGMASRSPMPTMPPRNGSMNGTGDFPELCYELLDQFQFPVFEVLVTFQVICKDECRTRLSHAWTKTYVDV